MMIPIEKPRTNPPITAFDRKFDTQPIRATPSARYTTPVASAKRCRELRGVVRSHGRGADEGRDDCRHHGRTRPRSVPEPCASTSRTARSPRALRMPCRARTGPVRLRSTSTPGLAERGPPRSRRLRLRHGRATTADSAAATEEQEGTANTLSWGLLNLARHERATTRYSLSRTVVAGFVSFDRVSRGRWRGAQRSLDPSEERHAWAPALGVAGMVPGRGGSVRFGDRIPIVIPRHLACHPHSAGVIGPRQAACRPSVRLPNRDIAGRGSVLRLGVSM